MIKNFKNKLKTYLKKRGEIKMKKQIKRDIKKATTGISKRGYKGGYLISSNEGWNEETSNLTELRGLLLEELLENPEQEIDIAVAFYDEELWNEDKEDYGAYTFDEGWVSSVGGYEAVEAEEEAVEAEEAAEVVVVEYIDNKILETSSSEENYITETYIFILELLEKNNIIKVVDRLEKEANHCQNMIDRNLLVKQNKSELKIYKEIIKFLKGKELEIEEYENIIVEDFKEKEKVEIYKAINNNDEVYYSTNQRVVPVSDREENCNVFETKYYKVVINPSEKQREYFSNRLFRINKLKSIVNKNNLINKIDIDNKRHLEGIRRRIDSQYSEENIRRYLLEIMT